ncbi:MAG: tetratricopeptide repeat protein, partial [Planctomycetota bacterium]
MNVLKRLVLTGPIRKAQILEEEGRYDEAKTLYESALEKLEGKERVGLLSRIGACALRTGKLSEARPPLEEAAELAPDDPTALLNLGL